VSLVLVTGCSTGIGFATALSLSRASHTVLAGVRRPESFPALEQARDEGRLALHPVLLDVNDDRSVQDCLDRAEEAHGPVDVLVNNAGLGGSGTVEETPLEVFRALMETNYFGSLRCMQAVLPAMRARRSGLIVNVSSVSGRLAMAGTAPYAASKFALEALSECLAQEVAGLNVRVRIVEPGVIVTPIFGKASGAPAQSTYPHVRRLAALYAALLTAGTPPSAVAARIVELVSNDDGRVRHLVGPDAVRSMDVRAQLADEAWIAMGAHDDGEWAARIGDMFGARIHL
jgi:NAD(P)-dependent dehydrogenase (short-subunit alcohol dehydrogenase family)